VTTSSDHLYSRERGLITSLRSSMPRSEYFAALCILCCANGIAPRVIQAVAQRGWADAVLSTFEISVIVWVAAAIGIGLVLEDIGDRMSATDLAVGGLFLFLSVLPGGGGSWLALTLLSLYMLRHSTASSPRRRGAMILLALTVPMEWAPLLFRCFSETILGVDASMVSRMLGTTQDGNMVRFADGSGDLVIFPACSSIANLSLVLVCWVTLSQAVGHRWTLRDLVWCFLAGASVVATNVTRISLMGLSEWHYQTVHSGLGDLIANVIAFCLTVGVCALGLRRELFPRI
jgi:hypothetical protein